MESRRATSSWSTLRSSRPSESSVTSTTNLYRPTGANELGLVYDGNMRGFPPRLPEQTIFYPVTNFPYAATIAREWNTRGPAGIGYVTCFAVDTPYSSQFERHVVGGREHEELWIPADDLQVFNDHIVGPITVVAAFFAPDATGSVPTDFGLRGRSASDQLVALDRLREDYPMDFHLEIAANHRVVWLNYPLWALQRFATSVIDESRRAACLDAVRAHWPPVRPSLPLLDQAAPSADGRAKQ